jgi:hypothetical protein
LRDHRSPSQELPDQNGEETKVECTFCYRNDAEGQVKIVAHKSAIPYSTE